MKNGNYEARAQSRSARVLREVGRQEEERTSTNTAQKRSGKKKRTAVKVKLEETTGRRDTAKNIVRNEKEKNEKKQEK